MTDPDIPPTTPQSPGFDATHGHGPVDESHLTAYIAVFVALCVCTSLSFLFNQMLPNNPRLSATLIAIVAVIKACLVAYIFMHLKTDWRRVYGIMIPVAIMAVMTVIILSIDGALVWHLPTAK